MDPQVQQQDPNERLKKISLIEAQIAGSSGYSAQQKAALQKALEQKKSEITNQLQVSGLEGGIGDPNKLAAENPAIIPQLLKMKQSGTLPEGDSADLQKQKRTKDRAEKTLEELENLYFGNPKKGDELHSGRLGGLLAKLRVITGTNPQLKTYEATIQRSRPFLARAMGDVGNLNLEEQIAAVKQLPSGFSTPEEAIQGFNSARRILGIPERDYTGLGAPAPQLNFSGQQTTKKSLEDIFK